MVPADAVALADPAVRHMLATCDLVGADTSLELPTAWRTLLADGPAEARARLVERAGMDAASEAAALITGAVELGVLVPKSQRRRGVADLWRLVAFIGERHVLSFEPPRGCDLDLPPAYVRFLSELGPCELSQYSGRVVGPAEAVAEGTRLGELFFERGAPQERVVAFYDHRTGDFDCWLGDEYDRVFTLNHEDCAIEPYLQGGFGAWFGVRLLAEARSLKQALE